MKDNGLVKAFGFMLCATIALVMDKTEHYLLFVVFAILSVLIADVHY